MSHLWFSVTEDLKILDMLVQAKVKLPRPPPPHVITQMPHYMSANSAGADTAPNWTILAASLVLWTVDTTVPGNLHPANLRI